MVDLFLSKNEKIADIENKMKSMERRMDNNFSRVDESFSMLRKILIEIQTENKELKKDRDFLLQRYKEVLRNLEITDTLATGIKYGVMEPLKNEIRESSNLIKEIASEGLLDPSSEKVCIDDLFEIVLNRKRVEAVKVAKELKVSEKRLTYWAMKLEKQKLIRMEDQKGRLFLVKI